MSFHPLLLASGTLVRVAQFLLSLSLLIALHEGGHFFFARLFKTRVEKFYLFFDFLFPFPGLLNFSLFKKKVGDTEYGIGWFPLGGYVKIAGMVDESMDKEQMAKPPEPWEYRSKPAWQRLFIMLGGIIVNVLTAIIIYSFVLFVWGEKKLPMSELKDGIMVVDHFGTHLGFKTGDKILSINGKPVQYFDDFYADFIYGHTVEIQRDGQPVTISLPENMVGQLSDSGVQGPLFLYRFPAVVGEVTKGSSADVAGLKPDDRIMAINAIQVPYFDQLEGVLDSLKKQNIMLTISRNGKDTVIPARVNDTGKLGFERAPVDYDVLDSMKVYHIETKKYGFFEAFPAGVKHSAQKVKDYAKQFTLIFNRKTGAAKGVGGFATMAKIFPKQWDWEAFWNITALLSIVLAFMNLLPIPGLDGGYVLFLLIEMITRRKVSDKVMEVANTIGLVLLLLLMVYANGNDIFKAFKGH